jgi:flagellar motor switch protein FliG
MADEDTTLDAPHTVKGTTAAAILMLLIDEDDAAAIMQQLEPDDIKALSKEMLAASEATNADIAVAIDSFSQTNEAISNFAVGLEPRVRNVVSQALGNVKGDNVLAQIAPQASAGMLDVVRWMELPVIARVLAEEHPQLGAIVLAVLTPEVAAAALEGLEETIQADLIYRSARLSNVSAAALADIQGVLESYTNLKGIAPPLRLGGKSDVAKIVNRLKKPTSDRILKSVKKLNKVLGEQIEEEMFIFDSLIELDSQALSVLLRSVDASLLGLALRGAEEALVNKMLCAMSARAALSVRDEMADSGPVKREEVDEAQKQIVQIARRLGDEGQIMLGSGGDDYV